MKRIASAMLAATRALGFSVPAAAQDTTTVDTTTTAPATEDDDNDVPWGLLGLLGLAGLLGRKRRDDEVRVNTTNDRR